MDIDRGWKLNSELEKQDEWGDWAERIPFIPIPDGWKIAVIPPFMGAVARFFVEIPGHLGRISVFLDGYERLGSNSGNPYWEVYPFRNDIGRCPMADVDRLVEMIADRSGAEISEDPSLTRIKKCLKRLS